MSPLDVVRSYYDSQNKKDDRWKELWAEDAVFCDASRTLLANGRAAVIQSFTPFLKGVAALKISHTIVEGEQICAIVSYTYVNPKSAAMNQDVAEVWQVRGSQLASLTLYFDLTAYRRFMQG